MIASLLAMLLAAAATGDDDPQAKTVLAAMAQLTTGHSAEALAAVEPALAAYDRRYAREPRQKFCSYSREEVLAAMVGAAGAKQDAVAIGNGWCDALFIKGFALADLRRYAEAAPVMERLVALAPYHAQYLSELGYVYQQQRDWPRSYALYTRARDASAMVRDERRAYERGRALRGMGYALIEQGRWDEAEAIYRECLQLDPADPRALNELRYIQDQRARPTT